MSKTFTGVCPECDTRVMFYQLPRLGQQVVCLQCSTRLEVVEVSPIELDWAYDDSSELENEDTSDDYDADWDGD